MKRALTREGRGGDDIIAASKNQIAASTKPPGRQARAGGISPWSSRAGVLGVVASVFLSISLQAGPNVLTFLASKNQPSVDLTITKKPTSYSADGIGLDLTDFDNQNPPRLDDVYSLSFATSSKNSFADIEDKTYEAANPGPNQNSEDLLTQAVTDPMVTTDILHPGLKILSFDIAYGPNNLPADDQTFFGDNHAYGFVLITYNPAENNQIVNAYVDLSAGSPPAVPETASAFFLLTVAFLSLVALRNWRVMMPAVGQGFPVR